MEERDFLLTLPFEQQKQSPLTPEEQVHVDKLISLTDDLTEEQKNIKDQAVFTAGSTIYLSPNDISMHIRGGTKFGKFLIKESIALDSEFNKDKDT